MAFKFFNVRKVPIAHRKYRNAQISQIKFKLRYVCIENENLCSSVNFCVICVLWQNADIHKFFPALMFGRALLLAGQMDLASS